MPILPDARIVHRPIMFTLLSSVGYGEMEEWTITWGVGCYVPAGVSLKIVLFRSTMIGSGRGISKAVSLGSGSFW